jgi:hypothetical protein
VHSHSLCSKSGRAEVRKWKEKNKKELGFSLVNHSESRVAGDMGRVAS